MTRTTLILFSITFIFLCSSTLPDDKMYKEQDQKIILEFNNIREGFLKENFDLATYFCKLTSLHKKENELIEKIKLYKFLDIEEYNYWHRGRLKFPSLIKMEIDLIKEHLNK